MGIRSFRYKGVSDDAILGVYENDTTPTMLVGNTLGVCFFGNVGHVLAIWTNFR